MQSETLYGVPTSLRQLGDLGLKNTFHAQVNHPLVGKVVAIFKNPDTGLGLVKLLVDDGSVHMLRVAGEVAG